MADERLARIFYAPMLVLSLVIGGFYVKTLWGWYVVPLGVVEISHAHAMGLILLSSLTRTSRADFEHMAKTTPREDLVWIISVIIGMSIVAAMAWGIYAWWM